MPSTTRSISLLDSLNEPWFKLPLAVMQDAGPAAQTLAGLMKVSLKETFVPVADIAARARLPIGTVRKHLATLHDHGWINNKGRQPTRRNWKRRTATIAITQKTRDALDEYGFLPWWSCCSIAKVGRLPWSAKAVLSVVVARLAGMKRAITDHDGMADLDANDMQGSIDNLGGKDRFQFSLKSLCEQTGLDHKTVIKAKRMLNHKFGIVDWAGTGNKPEIATTTDLLAPNWHFRVTVIPAGEGLITLAFSKGK